VSAPKVAMVLAAGLGTRMRPLTDDRPKALVEVAGRALIDHVLDRLGAAGAERAVVNVHAHADRLTAHLRARRGGPEIVVSDERDAALPLETGGGVRRAAPLLGDGPVWIANIDSVWTERAPALPALAAGYDPARMDARLLLAPVHRSLGFDGPGDADLGPDGAVALRRVTGAAEAPYAYMGVAVIDPRPAYAWPAEHFSLAELWAVQARAGRLHGAVLDGEWMHVGDPRAREAAEARLRAAAGGG
jgi:N-acetyl-alpha-D-muramate 1-phosphate uridylyltransferase